MLLDHYTASYYQARDQLKSLIIVTEFEFRRDVGVLFSCDRKDLADCLTFHRSIIWRLVQTNTGTFKVILTGIECKYNLLSYPLRFKIGGQVRKSENFVARVEKSILSLAIT